MSLLLYNLFCRLYAGVIGLLGFNAKARAWAVGRREQRPAFLKPWPAGERRIWVHCSSLGEFEQGRPLIERLRADYPNHKIVLTFFSPSGYEIQKNYAKADYVFYLPMDGRRNAAMFLDAVAPELAFFVKYEFWYHYLCGLHHRGIPAILVSAAFRREQVFFKPYGGFFRKLLGCFTLLFVQDEGSRALLAGIGLGSKTVIAGDTRYDRVADIEQNAKPIPEAAAFCTGSHILVAGSTWPDDEQALRKAWAALPPDVKMIIAPHEIHEAHIDQVVRLFEAEGCVLFSAWKAGRTNADARVMVIDNIGMLSSLYAYGTIAYVGGGFAKGGIHNILEPAVFGLPVVFGPVYGKFVEAVAMANRKLVFPIANEDELRTILTDLFGDEAALHNLNASIRSFMQHNIGATGRILQRVAPLMAEMAGNGK